MHAGVDEAGRGPVLGPLVVAGVLADPDTLPDGIADSKRLTAEARERLAERLQAAPDVQIARVTVTAPELNRRMDEGQTLDTIEARAFLDALDALDPPRAVVDTVGQDADGFGARLTEAYPGECRIEARREADVSDPVVGAASILAKVERDARVARLADEVGEPIGSGYPSDPATRSFLEAWRERRTQPPPFARTSWATLERLGFGTRKITEFDEGGST